jgi:hypothetical protein
MTKMHPPVITNWLFRNCLLPTIIFIILQTGCGPADLPQQDMERRIAQAVIGTVAALPSGTPYPTPLSTRVIPTPTPDPTGLFCEYRFCIGHPADVSFVDLSFNRDANPVVISTYGQGKILAFRSDLFLFVIWQQDTGKWNPQAMLDIVMGGDDTSAGATDVQRIDNLDVAYMPIKPPDSANQVPFGGAATWRCGNRDFAWKAYTPQDGQAKELLKEALMRFYCSQ